MKRIYLYGLMICMLMGCQSQPEAFLADRELDYCASHGVELSQGICRRMVFRLLARSLMDDI